MIEKEIVVYSSWVITILSIVGTVLNIYKIRACFYIWAITDVAWIIIDLYYKVYSQAALFFVYLILAAWGLVRWTRNTSS